jgi:hypothetical protein
VFHFINNEIVVGVGEFQTGVIAIATLGAGVEIEMRPSSGMAIASLSISPPSEEICSVYNGLQT